MAPAGVDIGNSLQNSSDTFFGYLPNVLGFLVILVVGYVIARLVKAIVNKAADKLKVDQALKDSSAGGFVERVAPGGRPSHIIGGVAFWLIFLFALTAAIGALKIPAVTAFMDQVLAYLPNVIAAVLIFVVAAAISTAIVAAVQKTMADTPTGKLVQAIVPGLVMAISVFMILNQLKIATAIVTITYAALLGMLALAGALAFGLGGRDVAAQMWSDAYDKAQDAREQARADAELAKERAQEQLGELDEDSDDTQAYPVESTQRTRSTSSGSRSRSRARTTARTTASSGSSRGGSSGSRSRSTSSSSRSSRSGGSRSR